MEVARTVPGIAERVGRALAESNRALLKRAEVVVGEQVGEVLAPLRERLDPFRGPPVLQRSLDTGDLPVGDVADEDVPKCVLVLAAGRVRQGLERSAVGCRSQGDGVHHRDRVAGGHARVVLGEEVRDAGVGVVEAVRQQDLGPGMGRVAIRVEVGERLEQAGPDRRVAEGVELVDGRERSVPHVLVPGLDIEVGPGRVLDNGDRVTLDLKEGDRVLFAKYAGTEFKHEGDDLLILSEKDVLGILVSNGQ